MSKRPNQPEPIGETLRRQRVEVLDKGLREMAAVLEIAPAHLTDIEKGRRTPSEELLLRITKHYQLPEAVLRSGWSRPDAAVAEIASLSATNAEKVPAFLKTAKSLSPDQWDKLIEQAKTMARGDRKSGGG